MQHKIDVKKYAFTQANNLSGFQKLEVLRELVTLFRKLVGWPWQLMVVSALLREVRPRYSPNHHTFRHASMNETARTLTLRKKGSRKPQISAPKQISGPTSTKAAGEKLLDVRRERPGQSETSGK